jgi:hypothetical protein
MGDNLPEYKGPFPMARPGYTIPPQKTDIELFGAPERPAGWAIGPPSNAVDDVSGPRSHPASNALRSPTVVPVAIPNHQSPFVSPVALNPGADASTFAFGNASGPTQLPSQTPRKLARPIGSQPVVVPVATHNHHSPFISPVAPNPGVDASTFAFGNESGAPGPAHLPSQTPRKLARPIGSQPADFDPQPTSTKTPKTPFAPLTPRMPRPLGAPTAEPEEIAPAITPFVPPSKPFPPKMHRPAGAPMRSPEFGALPLEDLAVVPAAQSKPSMPRPGMSSWDSVPKVDTFQMMGGPASQSHHFSTPGPAHRLLPSLQSVAAPRASNTPQPVIPNFEKSAQQPGPGWRTGPMPVIALPPSSPGQTQAHLDEAVNVWGRQPTFQRPRTPKVDPPSPSPIIPATSQAPAAPPAPGAFEAAAAGEVEQSWEPTSSSANRNRAKKARAKAKKSAAKGQGAPGGPQPVSTLVRATSPEGKSSPNSKPVGIPNLTITAPSPSVSPAPPDNHADAPLVRPMNDGSGGSVTHIAGPFVYPPSPTRTNKSQKPTIEEVTDEDAPRRTPMHSSAKRLPPSRPIRDNGWSAWE